MNSQEKRRMQRRSFKIQRYPSVIENQVLSVLQIIAGREFSIDDLVGTRELKQISAERTTEGELLVFRGHFAIKGFPSEEPMRRVDFLVEYIQKLPEHSADTDDIGVAVAYFGKTDYNKYGVGRHRHRVYLRYFWKRYGLGRSFTEDTSSLTTDRPRLLELWHGELPIQLESLFNVPGTIIQTAYFKH